MFSFPIEIQTDVRIKIREFTETREDRKQNEDTVTWIFRLLCENNKNLNFEILQNLLQTYLWRYDKAL